MPLNLLTLMHMTIYTKIRIMIKVNLILDYIIKSGIPVNSIVDNTWNRRARNKACQRR